MVFLKKILVVTVLFLGSYVALVKGLGPTKWLATQHTYQESLAKAEQYLYYTHQLCPRVVVGSSLSSMIQTFRIPGTCSLTFPGQTVFEGLRLLTENDSSPTCVYIEMNAVLRSEDKEFVDYLQSPVPYFLKKYLRVMRHDKQPIAKIGQLIHGIVEPHLITNTTFDKHSTQLHQYFRKESDISPKEYILDRQMQRMEELVSILEKKGCQIVFFEMPISPDLTNLAQPRAIRAFFLKHFSPTKYTYIFPEKDKIYTTLDGIHLTYEAALEYTAYFKKQVQEADKSLQ
ncbi:hypothetical protein [Arundinibacter roseus]|uniref:SGNH/GDSL hydrolase family protein n=1 Tax=Arundinibacter roseus TaxID=2070510 RepID=A0A4R4K572_9BACT|nr:hypothetical protein [Arundinibacter roseus]TDB61792.1 hypothetical protein EZE20_18780 [Arundinibacter roseus]